MLKEALRAGVPPHSIPQIFGNNVNQSLTTTMYTPASPTTGPVSNPRPAAAAQPHSYRVAKRDISNIQTERPAATTSPRQLPKLETSIPPIAPFPVPAPVTATSGEARSMNHSQDQAVSASGSEPTPSSIFFHHWQPPSQSYNTPVPADNVPRTAEHPNSPTPRRKRLLSSSTSTYNSASRQSPIRGHSRHRSEASTLSGRLPDIYHPISDRRATERRSTSPKLSSYELDSARKRKREEGFDVLAHARHQSLAPPATIREESRVVS